MEILILFRFFFEKIFELCLTQIMQEGSENIEKNFMIMKKVRSEPPEKMPSSLFISS